MASIEGTRLESMEQLGQSSKENANLKSELQKTWHENQSMAQEVQICCASIVLLLRSKQLSYFVFKRKAFILNQIIIQRDQIFITLVVLRQSV